MKRASKQQTGAAVPSSSRPQSTSNQIYKQRAPIRLGNNRDTAPELPGNFAPVIDDNDEMVVEEEYKRPTAEYVTPWEAYDNDKNKENRPVSKTATKFSLLDPQPNAQRIEWNSQEDDVGPSVQKRPRSEREESEQSEDQGFEKDQRIPDPTRRVVAQPTRPLSPVQDNPSAQKRARVSHRAHSPGRGDS